MVHKYRDVSLGHIILFCDLTIITSSYVVLQDWEKVLYGYVLLFVISFVVDHLVNSLRQSVQFFIISDKYQEIGEAINQILDKLNAVHSYIETGNSLLNHIVNQKLETAREKGILVKAEIENLSFANMKSMDFSAMLSNLLDNAIEASEKETDVRPEINVSIFQKRGYEAVCVKNRIGNSVLQKNPGLSSTKDENKAHGMGIPQIREKYQGMCDFYEEASFFCACVFIPK